MQPPTPVNYRISIEPDLSRFTFTGTADIRFEAQSPVDTLVLNALQLDITRCQVKTAHTLAVCEWRSDPDAENLRIALPEKMDGSVVLRIDYRGAINDQMAGFYRSAYCIDGDTRYMAVTQFQESDARRAFPCVDHPAAKATFDIELIVDPHLTVLSNSAVADERTLPSGKKCVRFEQTPIMSTYLVFFGVGAFEVIRDDADSRVRTATLPGMAAQGAFGRRFGAKAIKYCEDYYAIDYPLPKLDLIAIPDFAFGAMENWGAITFRENLLLYYPQTTSRQGKARICEVIAHEIVHQWFGNLVTPSEWKYLWLNESFATYFGFGVVDHYYPQWQTWDQFLIGQTEPALNRDAMHETFPIEIPGGEHVVINSSTAPIIYSKGGSILRQVEGFIGTEAFQEGLRIYLSNHRYGCAESRHLWEALETASDQPISAMMQSWVGQPGHPLIRVDRDGDQLILEQERFTYLPKTYDQRWMIPVTATVFGPDGTRRPLAVLCKERQTRIDLGADAWAYKINRRQTGFYRVWYADATNLERLGRMVADKTLDPEDRWGLAGDFFARLKQGHASLDAYLDLLGFYRNEDAFLPLAGIAGNLFSGFLIVTGAVKEKIAAAGKDLSERILATIGFEPEGGESQATAALRDQVLWYAVVFGSRQATAFAEKAFARLAGNGGVHADIKRSVLQAGAFCGGKKCFDWIIRQIGQTDNEHDRMNLLTALGSFREPALIQQARDYLLENVPDRNRFVPVVAMCQNPHAIPTMWDWYLSRIDALEQSHPLLYERIVASIVPVCGLEKADAVRAFLTDYMESRPQMADIVRLSLERLEMNLSLRNRAG